jgi:hypothetical protein
MRLLFACVVAAFSALSVGHPAGGADGSINTPPTIDVGVVAPGEAGGAGPEEGGGDAETAPAEGVFDEAEVSALLLDTVICTALAGLQRCEDETPEAAVPAVDPRVLAQAALDTAAIPQPEPHTSPDGVAQITGMQTWFWLPAEAWVPVTARAELPGIWAEVTATPTHATWTSGDGAAAVTCDGPGRPHPGSAGATTDCGHTYTDVGSYPLAVEVTYAVSWTSSTGTSAGLEPITVAGEVPVTVEQRQAVID